MGAYLHLRGLTELEELSDFKSNVERFQHLDEEGPGAVGGASTSTPGRVGATSRGRNSSFAMEIDCSNFWAGKLDDAVDGLQVRTGYRDAVSSQSVLDGSVQRDMDFSSQQKLEGCENRDSSPTISVSSKNTCVRDLFTKNQCSEDVSFVDSGGKFADFHSSILEEADLIVRHTGGMHATAVLAASSNLGSNFAEVQSNGGNGTVLYEGKRSGEMENELVSSHKREGLCEKLEDESERLPDHLLIELLVRVPTQDWPAAACVKKRWAQLFKGDGLWHSALVQKWPSATSTKRWPGPIARGTSKRRYTALYASETLFSKDKVEGVNEVAGHVYLFLKEQLEASTTPVSYGLLHGTIIDQFLACCKTGDEAHDLASIIWVAVLDNLDESENTFHLLMRIAEEWEVFLPYPYAKSRVVQWRLFERLFTDFRDCLSQYNYFDVLARARNKFELIPQTWLGY